MFVTRITLSHDFKKKYKNEQMMSKGSAQEFARALDFEPWCREPRAALFEYMPFVRVLGKHNIL